MSRKEAPDNRKLEGSSREEINRFEEQRALDERKAQERVVMNMAYKSPFHIDQDSIPADVDYYWIRTSLLGVPDTKRMVEARRGGWTPVPASRHPEMVFGDLFGNASHMDSFINYSGMVLCERSKEIGRIEEQEIRAENYRTMTSMPGTENFMGEPGIPARNNSEVYTSKAYSVK